MAARRIRIPCRITEATNTHSEYVILTAFPLQQWLHPRDSIWRYTYNACLVFLLSFFYFFVLTLLFFPLLIITLLFFCFSFLMLIALFQPRSPLLKRFSKSLVRQVAQLLRWGIGAMQFLYHHRKTQKHPNTISMYKQPPHGTLRKVKEYQSNANNNNIACNVLDGHL